MPRGGHFAAMEEPQLMAEDMRTFFRPLRAPLIKTTERLSGCSHATHPPPESRAANRINTIPNLESSPQRKRQQLSEPLRHRDIGYTEKSLACV
jgi:hypothetical protein